MERALSFGLNDEVPATATTAWGARWIYPDDMVFNRQDFVNIDTPSGKRLKTWLDTKGISKAKEAARKRLVRSDEERTIVLFEDETGIIKGNPNRSHGYLYVCGYLREESGEKYEPKEEPPKTTTAAKKRVKTLLDADGIKFDKLRGETTSFTDLARDAAIFVYVIGVEFSEMPKIANFKKRIPGVIIKVDGGSVKNVPAGQMLI